MHISVVSIEGDHLNDIADVLKRCEYVVEDSFTVQTGDEAAKELDWSPNPDRVAKVAYSDNGWTTIIDPELTLMTEDVWVEYSKEWNNRVFGWVCEGASGTYGLVVFDTGRKRRDVMAVAGDIAVNDGEPLPEESGTDWEQACEDEVLDLAEQIGPGNDFLADREYTVFHLDESQMVVPDLPSERPAE